MIGQFGELSLALVKFAATRLDLSDALLQAVRRLGNAIHCFQPTHEVLAPLAQL